jgi:thiamine biosynthesis lipoprotein
MTSLRKRWRVLWLPVLVVACSEASNVDAVHELAGATMGTTFNVKLLDPNLEFADAVLQDDIESLLANLNDNLSTYRADSEISRFNLSGSTDWFAVSQLSCDIVAQALAVSDMTDGAFDVTVGPLVDLWGFGPDGSISAPPAADDIRTAVQVVGYRKLHTDCSVPAIRKELAGLSVDLSAYAKGFAVDQVANLLDAKGVENYLVEIGGELRLRGSNARGVDWAIGIESPVLTRRSVHSIVDLTDVAIATSGDYRNFFESDGELYSHTIDPRTGYPVAHSVASVTVVAATAADADALATALMVLGAADGLEFAEREQIAALFQLRIDDVIEERASDNFAAMLAGG